MTLRTRRRPVDLAAGFAALVALALVITGTAGATVSQAADGAVDGLAIWEALLLGLVEGLTEFLPVSSTGHLLATNTLLGLDDTEASEQAIETYAICIQAGAILAVIFLYRERIRQMVDGLLGRSDEGRRVLWAVVAAFIPTALIGLTVANFVRDNLFGIGPVAVAWLVGGVVVLVLDRQRWFGRGGIDLGDITTRQAVIVGVAQAIALWPGVSRSLVTIIAAVAVGLSLKSAVEFSFLLGFVTLSAATVLEGARGGSELIDTFGVAAPLAGLVMAFVSAVLAVRWMVAGLERQGFGIFGWYRVGVGVLALALIAAGVL